MPHPTPTPGLCVCWKNWVLPCGVECSTFWICPCPGTGCVLPPPQPPPCLLWLDLETPLDTVPGGSAQSAEYVALVPQFQGREGGWVFGSLHGHSWLRACLLPQPARQAIGTAGVDVQAPAEGCECPLPVCRLHSLPACPGPPAAPPPRDANSAACQLSHQGLHPI